MRIFSVVSRGLARLPAVDWRRQGSATVVLALLLTLAPSGFAATFKIATVSPDGSMWMRMLRRGAEEVSSRTEGRVAFKFYPGGVMGDDKAVLRKIRSGQLHGAVLTAGGLNQVYPDIQLYTLPMVFNDYEEVDFVRSSMEAGQTLPHRSALLSPI